MIEDVLTAEHRVERAVGHIVQLCLKRSEAGVVARVGGGIRGESGGARLLRSCGRLPKIASHSPLVTFQQDLA